MHVSLILPDGANIAMEESGNVVDDASIGKNFDDPLLLDVPQILFLALFNDFILVLGIQDILWASKRILHNIVIHQNRTVFR